MTEKELSDKLNYLGMERRIRKLALEKSMRRFIPKRKKSVLS